MNPVNTPAQRRAVLRNIDRAERAMIPADWTPPANTWPESEGTRSAAIVNDYATRNAMPSPYLLDTAPAPKKTPAKLRAIKPAPAPSLCGFGTCAIDPACTGPCRYRAADEALRGHYSSRPAQRAPMPPTERPGVNPRARRITWVLLTLWLIGWTAGPVLWWLFS